MVATADAIARCHLSDAMRAVGCSTGPSNRAMARLLAATEKTVEKHIATIISKLDRLPEPDDDRRVLAVWVWLQGQREQSVARP